MIDLKRKPSGIWFAEWTDDAGKRRRISTGTRDQAQARAAAMRILQAGGKPERGEGSGMAAGAPQKPKEGLRLSRLLEDCLKTIWHPDAGIRAQASIRSNVRVVSRYIGDLTVDELTTERLTQFVLDMRAEGYAPGTIKRKLTMLSAALKTLLGKGPGGEPPILDKLPEFPPVVVRNMKDRVISPFEEERMWRELETLRQEYPTQNWWLVARFLRVLLDTGFRLSEALSLGPSSVSVLNARGRTVTMLNLPRYATKSERPHSLPATPALVEMIPALNEQAVKGRWFPVTPALMQYRWSVLREAADMQDVTLHTFRHTCITRLLQGGMDIARVSKWANHANISITATRYGHLAAADLVGGLDILGAVPPTANIQSPDSDYRDNGYGMETGAIGDRPAPISHTVPPLIN